MTGANCGTCVFWIKPDPEQNVGLCRRYPPTTLLIGIQNQNGQPAAQTQSAWPPLLADGWCGEHSPKPVQLDG